MEGPARAEGRGGAGRGRVLVRGFGARQLVDLDVAGREDAAAGGAWDPALEPAVIDTPGHGDVLSLRERGGERKRGQEREQERARERGGESKRERGREQERDRGAQERAREREREGKREGERAREREREGVNERKQERKRVRA